jgi:hypothetical protein
MSWTYSGNPKASVLDECRFLISDTNESAPIMQDEEIQFIIDEANGNVNLLRYNLFRQAATIFARDIKRSLGPQSEDPTTRLNFYNAQMAEYKAKLQASGLSIPNYAYPKIFRKGMQSNPPWRSKPGAKYV